MSDNNSDKTRRRFLTSLASAGLIGSAGCAENSKEDNIKEYIDVEQIGDFNINFSNRIHNIYPVKMNNNWFIRLETDKNGLILGKGVNYTPTNIYMSKGNPDNMNRVSKLYDVGTIGSEYDIPILTDRRPYFPEGESSKDDILSSFKNNKYNLVIHYKRKEDPATNTSEHLVGMYQQIKTKNGELKLIGEVNVSNI